MKILVALIFVLGFVVADVAGGAFDEEAYPVKWSPRSSESSFAAPPPREAFDEEAYPVKWSPRSSESFAAPPPREAFDEEAYPVKWSPRSSESSFAAPPPPSALEAMVYTKHHIDVKKGVLFLERNLFDGAVLPANTKLGHATWTGSPGVIPPTDPAPPLQFHYANLGHILAFYNITHGSEHARQVATTLLFCRGIDDADQKEEPEVCATTQRAAMDFAAAELGTTARAARTVVHGRREPLRYVVKPNGIAGIGNAVVPCHPLPYPTDVLYCHRPSGVQAVRVELVGQEDPSLGATAIAVCHQETGGWDEEYFVMLNGTRGEPVCHYMTHKYVLWVAQSS